MIAIYISDHNRVWKRGGVLNCALKSSVAVTEENADRTALRVGDGQVKFVIAVEVGYCNRGRNGAPG
jgi:hypothetical protein